MKPRRVTLAICVLGFGIAVALAVAGWLHGRVSAKPEDLLSRLPTQDAVVTGFDVQTLRRGGYLQFLANTKNTQEPEYTSFVNETGFDYTRDLDYVLASFAPDGEFFLVRGTFDWPKLEAYALRQKGSCYDHLCRMKGSRADRNISFFPLRHDVLAMAVAPDDSAATRLTKAGPQGDIDVPKDPVWISISSGALRHSPSLPGSSKLFASAITDANRVTLTLSTERGNLEARLDAICRDPQQAGALAGQLSALTAMLRTTAQREGKPVSRDDLAGLLTAGTFHEAGTHVLGKWPVDHALIENLAGGI